MENYQVNPVCGGKDGGCQWIKPGPRPLICESSNTANCSKVNILEAEKSDFHNTDLIEATRAINEILAKIPADSNGRNLSFLQTNMGQLLAWVEHGGDSGGSGVTADDDDETVIAALNLKV